MGLLEEKEEIIEKVKNVSAIEFYKKLKLQIIIETKRLDIYLGQLNSISAVLVKPLVSEPKFSIFFCKLNEPTL